MRKQPIKIAASVCLAGVLFFGLFQNCAPLQSEAKVKTNAPSPFADESQARNGIILSAGVRSLMGTAAAKSMGGINANDTIPAGTKLGFVVSDACMTERVQTPLNRYFLDRFTDRNMTLAPNAKFAQSLIMVILPGALTFDGLVKIKRSDSCILAIADDQGIQFKLSAADPLRPQQDYLDRMQFDPAYFDANTDAESVSVAVIDSGYDFTKADPITLVSTDLLIGSNRYNNSSVSQDDLGHGTEVTSLIAAKQDDKGILGVASRVSKILPIRVTGKGRTPSEPDGIVSTTEIFYAIKHAVNAGADVVNLSLGVAGGAPLDQRFNGMPMTCDPLLGQAFFEAVDNNVFVVTAAGSATSCVRQPNGTIACLPGSISSPKDNSTEDLYEFNFIPACWARYYKGVIAVAATDSAGAISSVSNWGEDAVEMAAPGENILTQTTGGGYVRKSGTSFSTALVTGAVSNTIGFFKKRGWSYNPWMIEDTLINGTPTNNAVWGTAAKKVRLGKSLNFKALTDYLTTLTTMTDAQRRQQPSDNPEAGVTLNRGLASPGRQPIRLEVYTKEKFIAVDRQAQIQAVLYYDDATLEVISDKVTWTTSDPTRLPVSSTGLAVPSQRGSYTVSAKFGTLGGQSTIEVVDFNTWTGSSGTLQKLGVTVLSWQSIVFGRAVPNAQSLEIVASYSDGRVRKVNDITSFLARTDGNSTRVFASNLPNIVDGKPFWVGGLSYKIIVLYRGIRQDIDFVMPHWTVAPNGDPTPSQISRYADTSIGVKFNNQFLNDGEPAISGLSLTVQQSLFQGPTDLTRSFSPGPMAVSPVNAQVLRPDVNSVSSTVTFTWTDWGSGIAKPYTISKFIEIVTPKPIGIVFGNGSATGNLASISLDRTMYTGLVAPVVIPKIVFDNGSEQLISITAEMKILNANGEESPLNYALHNGSPNYPLDSTTNDPYVGLYIFKATPGETLKFRVRDTQFNLEGTLPITVGGILPNPVAKEAINLPRIGLLPAKLDDALCSTPAAQGTFAGGNGSAAAPYLVCNATQFATVKTIRNLNSFFRLMANIDISTLTQNVFPIGVPGGSDFDGNGFTIKNFAIADADNTVAMLALGGGVIHDLNIYNANLRGRQASLLQGSPQSVLRNVHADTIYVEGSDIYGLTLGAGEVTNVSVTHLQMKTTSGQAAGLVGGYKARISSSYVQFDSFFGAISSSFAGLAISPESIDRSWVEGSIRMGVSSRVAGLAYMMADTTTVTRSKAALDITAPGSTIGLLAYSIVGKSVYEASPVVHISNSDFTGTITTGSQFDGGRVSLVAICRLCRLSTNTATAQVNAYDTSGLAREAAGVWMVNNTIDFKLVNVPAGSIAGRAFATRIGVNGDPFFTYLSNNIVNFNGFSAPAINNDVDNKPKTDLPGVN